MNKMGITKPVMERIPLYLGYLRDPASGVGRTVSATVIANALGLGDVQVRKDLGIVSGAGKPKVGYVTEELIEHLSTYLSAHTENTAVLVGAGRLGQALLGYGGFAEYALTIRAAFDTDPAKIGGNVLPLSDFAAFCERAHPAIGIITVPESSADDVLRLMTENGIRAVWNFSRRRLRPPEGVLVRNEDLASSLAALSGQLNQIG